MAEVAMVLGVCERHPYRIKAKIRKEGVKGVSLNPSYHAFVEGENRQAPEANQPQRGRMPKARLAVGAQVWCAKQPLQSYRFRPGRNQR